MGRATATAAALVFAAMTVALRCGAPRVASGADEESTLTRRAPQAVISVFDRGACGNCHVIPGIPGADGTVGPDLSQIGKFAGKRRERYPAAEYLRESIREPDAFLAPGGYESGVMPQQFGQTLSAGDLQTLVDYLAALGVEALPLRAGTPRQIPDMRRPPESVLQPFAPVPGKAPTDAQLALGKSLFFDRRLSGNNSLSCASCHAPGRAFTDGQPVSRGYTSTELFRNAPTLLNVVFAKSLYWDGRMAGDDLPSTVRDHLTEAHFMGIDGRLLTERMKQAPAYVEMYRAAYDTEPDFGTTLKAIAAYVGSLVSPAAPFDRYLAGDVAAVRKQAAAGWRLFKGKAGCVRCHPPPLFTDHGFHNLGLTTDAALLDVPERHIAFRRFFRTLGVADYRTLRSDAGRYVVSMQEPDRGRFRTPSLREVGRTAPYMHDGRLPSLADVIDFYNRGGTSGQTSGLGPLALTDPEKQALIAFLETLSTEPVPVETPVLPDYALHPRGRGLHDFALPEPDDDQPAHAPRPLAVLPVPASPADNPGTADKVALGRLLFFDPRLSADSAVSCNTCHPAHTGYTARTPISMGGTGTSHWRNASTLYNVAYYERFNWDGARPSIEEQNDGAWNGAVAGNLDADMAEERLAQVPEYRRRFRAAFGGEYPTWTNALRAVAAYQRTLVSRNVPFDEYLRGNDTAISDAAKRGHLLFTGKANCIACHDGPLLSDDRHHALGVPRAPEFDDSPLKQITFRFEQLSLGVPRAVYDVVNDDLGLYYVTKRRQDVGKFRTPSLRELQHTAPYMHNGVFRTLPEVVAFYNAGGGAHENGSRRLKPLGLTPAEQADLVAFLECLSGDPLTDRPPPLAPYGPYEPTSKGDHP